jgi:hypothetical protein
MAPAGLQGIPPESDAASDTFQYQSTTMLTKPFKRTEECITADSSNSQITLCTFYVLCSWHITVLGSIQCMISSTALQDFPAFATQSSWNKSNRVTFEMQARPWSTLPANGNLTKHSSAGHAYSWRWNELHITTANKRVDSSHSWQFSSGGVRMHQERIVRCEYLH